MNILWVINIPLPEASKLLNEKPLPFGGWLINVCNTLSDKDNINLFVAFPQKNSNEIRFLNGEKINYCIFTPIDYKRNILNEKNFQLEYILKKVKPDIVHIYGTEFPHTLSMVNICNRMNVKTVISIQGLVSVISKHYMACLPYKIQNRFTFRDFIKQDNLKQQQKKFIDRGKLEIESIKKVKNIIGRTTWDKACTTQINPNINYYICNETLRSEFYKHIWSLDNCEKFSIFVSQGQYPIKGLHFMIEAMPLILKQFPDAKLYIAGPDITKSDTLKDRLKKTSYSKYIIELIKKYNLSNNIIFTGLLNEKQMCERFLKTNVFVSPSIIENESNSLSEAKILGVPCVASYVGGVIDRINHKQDGFHYQVDAPYMLAYYVCKIFEDDELAFEISKKARERALKMHDREKNINTLLNIYEKIINE